MTENMVYLMPKNWKFFNLLKSTKKHHFFHKRNGTHVVTTILQLIVMLWNCGDTPVYTYGDSKLLVTIILNPKICHHNSKV